MDSDSDNEPLVSPTDNALRLVNPEILAALNHLDLSGRVTIQRTKVVRAGAYGDVSKAICILQGRGKIKVAIKMLRFYLAEDIQTVRACLTNYFKLESKLCIPAVRERDICVVKAKPPQHTFLTGIHIRW